MFKLYVLKRSGLLRRYRSTLAGQYVNRQTAESIARIMQELYPQSAYIITK